MLRTKQRSQGRRTRWKDAERGPMALAVVGPSCLGPLAWIAGSGCSIHRYALNKSSDAVAQSGDTFTPVMMIPISSRPRRRSA